MKTAKIKLKTKPEKIYFLQIRLCLSLLKRFVIIFVKPEYFFTSSTNYGFIH